MFGDFGDGDDFGLGGIDFGDGIDFRLARDTLIRCRRWRRRCRRCCSAARRGTTASRRTAGTSTTHIRFGSRIARKNEFIIPASAAIIIPQLATVHLQRTRRIPHDHLARFQPKGVFAVDLVLAAIDIGADPEVDAGGGGVESHAFFAVVHVLEVLLEEGEVDDFAGGEVGVVEGGGEGFGVGVGAVAWMVVSVDARKKRE